jgi:hypothetical protein
MRGADTIISTFGTDPGLHLPEPFRIMVIRTIKMRVTYRFDRTVQHF